MIRTVFTRSASLFLFVAMLTAWVGCTVCIRDTSLYDTADSVSLGLKPPHGLECVTVFRPDEVDDHFANGVVMTAYRGALYCMWQSSRQDEDAPDTRVLYSRSIDDGKTWCLPRILCDDHTEGYCTSGGWIATEERLIAFINVWQTTTNDNKPTAVFTRYKSSIDGLQWSAMTPVRMADGSPMEAIFEQDPHQLADGRWVGAAHFGTVLKVCPIYTDDPQGIGGWYRGDFEPTPHNAGYRELEPSLYVRRDGSLVMIFRDQASSFHKLQSVSKDRGVTWSAVEESNLPDARTKQSAGNLPDGTVFLAGNPVENKARMPLVLTLSLNGKHFNCAYLLGAGGEAVPPVQFAGRAKRRGYHYPKSMIHNESLYISYALNKEIVQYCKIPLSALNSY